MIAPPSRDASPCPPLDGESIEGWSASALAERFGTPLNVISETRLRANAREFVDAFTAAWPEGDVLIMPALKANYAIALRRVLNEEGLGCDVFTEAELEIALRSGTEPTWISFSGSLKSREALERAVAAGVNVTLDSVTELRTVAEVAQTLGRRATVRFRVRPQYARHLVSEVRGGSLADAAEAYKPGIAWEHLVPAGRWALGRDELDLAGVMMHIGRHSAELAVWAGVGEAFGRLIGDMSAAWDGWVPRTVDVGGGLPVGLDPTGATGELPSRPDVATYAETICAGLRGALEDAAVPTRGIRLEAEPGRRMYADCGAQLTRVRHVKRQSRPISRTWVELDTSIAFLADTEIENNRWPLRVFSDAPEELVDVVGCSCSSDVLVRAASIPGVRPGALIAIGLTGAYQDGTASNFNAMPRPGMVLVCGAEADLIKVPERLDDVIRRDRVPRRLGGRDTPLGVDHVSVTSSDLDRSLSFYCDLLGMTLISRGEGNGVAANLPPARARIADVDTGDGRLLELIQYLDPEGTVLRQRPCDPGSGHFAVRVVDARDVYERLVAAGVPVRTPPNVADGDGAWSGAVYFYAIDPDGATVEILERPPVID